MSKNPDRTSRPKVVLVNRALIVNKKGKVLLIKRIKNDNYMPGKWELPGGKLDAGQDITNALERETLEETGLVVIPTDKVAYWHSEIISSGKYKGLPYVVLVGLAKSIGNDVKLSNEHEDYAWVSKDQLLEYDLVPETKAALIVLSDKISK